MTDVPCWHGGRRCDLDFVESKPRDLGNDRGYRVVVAAVWAILSLNPHPSTAKGAAPNFQFERGRLANFSTRNHRAISECAAVWSEVVKRGSEFLFFVREKWRRRDESDMRSCRIGNVEGNGPRLVKPKKSQQRTRPQFVDVRINTAHNSWRRFGKQKGTKNFSGFFEKDTDFS
jgi:hypothetical protein